MKSKEDLFHLIHALSRSEKRYFTLDAQKSGRRGSKYLDLFQAINAMEEYDEDKLKKKFPRHLPSDKAYLYEAILRSMRDYRSVRSYSARIKELILDFKYLYERGLYSQASVRLEEAKELAAELDDQLALLELNREERTLVLTTRKDYDTVLQQLIAEKEALFGTLSREFEYLDAGYRLLIEIKRNPHLSEEEKKKRIASQFRTEMLAAENMPQTPYSQRLYFQCVALYSQLMGDHQQMADYFGKVVHWWQENSGKFKQDEFNRYVADISNLLNAYAVTGRYDRIPALVALLEKEEVSNVHDEGVVFHRAAIYKLMYHINTGRPEGVEALVHSIDQGLGRYSINLGTQLVLLFNTALLLFMQEKFSDCASWCRRITKGIRTSSRQDIQSAAHLLYLIAIFETGEPEEVDNALRSVYRFFSRQTGTDKEGFAYRVIDYFRKLANAPVREMDDWLEHFRAYLRDLRTDQTVNVPLGLDELLFLWAESRLEGKTILAVVRQKA